MKKFAFSLQTVHQLRDQRREQEELKFASLNQSLNEVNSELVQIEENRRQATKFYADKMQKNELDAFEIGLAMDYLRALSVRESDARARVAQAQTKCQEQSQVLNLAMQAVKATEKLRSQARQKFELEVSRQEQSELDELTVLKFARQLA